MRASALNYAAAALALATWAVVSRRGADPAPGCVEACLRGWADGASPPLCGPSARPPNTIRPDELPWLCRARCGEASP